MRAFVFLFFAVCVNAADIGSPIPFPRDERTDKPSCSCGVGGCLCKDGRIDPRCTCENCRCADVKGRRANVEETSDREANTTQAGTKAKEGCKTCGVGCDCGPNCQCSADYWKDYCAACPSAQRAAYMRSIAAARSVPQPFFGQPEYRTIPTTRAIGVGVSSGLSLGGPRMGIGIGAYAGTSGSTDCGVPGG